MSTSSARARLAKWTDYEANRFAHPRREGFTLINLNAFRTPGRSGLRVSPITLGTMTFGDGSWRADDETSVAIDTANVYNDGRSVETIGAYLDKRSGLRDRLVIATKFAANMFESSEFRIRQQVKGLARAASDQAAG